jgi:lysophospholipase L1-like esterase
MVCCLALLLVVAPGVARAEAPPPELIAPADDARFAEGSSPPVLEWSPVAGALSYEYEIGLDPEFAVTSGPLPAPGTAVDLGGLVDDALWQELRFTAYWRARAVAADGVAGAWSAVRSFHKSQLAPPALRLPEDARRYTSGDGLPRFTWEAVSGAVGYQVAFALDAEFVELLGIVETGAEPALDLGGADSAAWDAYSGVLYWRVAARDMEGVPGPWSEGRWFAKSTLEAPELVSPKDGEVFAPRSTPMVFRWKAVAGATSWELELAAEESFSAPLGSAVVDEPQLSLQEIDPEAWNYAWGTLWWRVSGITPEGVPGPWSAPRRFTKLGMNRFLAWGDSITAGECVENGYCEIILPQLEALFPGATIANRGIPGAKSGEGEERMEEMLLDVCPEFVLIQFGDNDCVDSGNCDPPFQCDVDLHMRAMAEICLSYGVTPIISTLVPINPISDFAWAQETASEWSARIREVADELGLPYADLEDCFFAWEGELEDLYCYNDIPSQIDWVHPNETGYGIMSDCFVDALMRLER